MGVAPTDFYRAIDFDDAVRSKLDALDAVRKGGWFYAAILMGYKPDRDDAIAFEEWGWSPYMLFATWEQYDNFLAFVSEKADLLEERGF